MDGLVSVSESEGLPVSMMEAVAAGLPVLGTDVGGVREIVTPEAGVLLEKDFTPEAFIAGAERLLLWKDAERRATVKRFFAANFEETRNYTRFVDEQLWPQVEESRKRIR